MKKILHIIYGFHNGGVEKVLLHYIDAKNYDITIMYLNDSDLECIEKFENVKTIRSPYNLTQKYRFYHYLSSYLKTHHFDIIHAHINKYNYIPLKCAYQNNIAVRISHCHGIDTKTHNILKKIYRIFLKKKVVKYATKCVACSKSAGMDLYGNNFLTIYNPIDLKTYYFDDSKRKKIREKYKIEKGTIILGNVGRLSYLKNHYFLFRLLNRLDSRYILMLVGDGELKESYQKYLKENHLLDRVIFTGAVADVSSYLSAMDIFLFPSITEGFGISLIESQANGLNTFASDSLPKETKISDQIQYLPLENLEEWITAITKCSLTRKKLDIKKNPFDINRNKDLFNQLYQ